MAVLVDRSGRRVFFFWWKFPLHSSLWAAVDLIALKRPGVKRIADPGSAIDKYVEYEQHRRCMKLEYRPQKKRKMHTNEIPANDKANKPS